MKVKQRQIGERNIEVHPLSLGKAMQIGFFKNKCDDLDIIKACLDEEDWKYLEERVPLNEKGYQTYVDIMKDIVELTPLFAAAQKQATKKENGEESISGPQKPSGGPPKPSEG